MTAVTADDIVAGAVTWLRQQPSAIAVVGTSDDGPLITQDAVADITEYTGGTAVVVAYGGGWAGANVHNTLKFPRLSVELWVDPIRVAGNIVEETETRRRLFAAWHAFDALLHRPQGGRVWWGTVRTVDSVRLGELSYYEVPAGLGLLRGVCFYGVQVG